MRAEAFGEGDIARLVERAGEIARFQDSAQQGGGIAGIGTEIAVAKIRRGKQRRPAGEIENEIAARRGAVAGLPERESAARRRVRLRVVVHDDLKSAEMALGRFDGALHHGKFDSAGQPQILGCAISTLTSR